MMYLPTHVVTPSTLMELTTPGLFLPLDGGNPLIIAANRDNRLLAVHLDANRGFPVLELNAGRYAGLHVTDVEFEVDPASVYNLGRDYTAAGSVARVADRLELVGAKTGSHYADEVRISLRSDLPLTSEAVRLGFLRWRAVLRDGANIQVLAECSVEVPERPTFD